VLLALLAAGGVALLAISLPRRRRSELPNRMAEFVSIPGLQLRGGRPGSPGQGAARADGSERPEDSGLWARFDRALEIAEIRTSGTGLVAATILGTAAVFLFLMVALSSIWWTLLAVLVPFGVRIWVTRTLDRRRRQFAEQLPDALQVISSALRSGHSFAGSLAVVVESAAEPMKTEMQRVVADEQRGLPLAISLEVVSRRMANRDLQQVGLVAELQREAGGNAAEVVDRVAETIRDRFELRRLISTLTVQGRMSRWIVTALPVSIILALQLINPHYLHPLVAHTGGRIVLGMAAALCVGGSLVIKKIVDIKV
jgi:tight adherence protein B